MLIEPVPPLLCDLAFAGDLEAALGLEYAKPAFIGRVDGCRYQETEVDEQGLSGSIGVEIEEDPDSLETYDYRRDIADDKVDLWLGFYMGKDRLKLGRSGRGRSDGGPGNAARGAAGDHHPGRSPQDAGTDA